MRQTGYEVFSFYYDKLTKNVDYAARANYFDTLIHTHLHTPGCVLLDLACGTGTMAQEMARRGYDVIGVDYSSGMLNRAMDKKFESGLAIQYVQQDMRELELYGTVDVTLCTLDSLNHLPDLTAIEEVFQRVAAATEPGGLFLFDMNTLFKHRQLLGNQVYVYETDEVYCVWENTLREDSCTVDLTLNLFEVCPDGRYRRKVEQITERAYAPEQIQIALKRAGFSVIGIYHADTTEPLHPNSPRMVVAAQKIRQK